MRSFGITLLVLALISGAISLIAVFTGNQYETANGVVFFGSAIGSAVLSCILVVLADIREAVRRMADKD